MAGDLLGARRRSCSGTKSLEQRTPRALLGKHLCVLLSRGCEQKARYSGNSLKITHKNALVRDPLVLLHLGVFYGFAGTLIWNHRLRGSDPICRCATGSSGKGACRTADGRNLNRVGSTRSWRPTRVESSTACKWADATKTLCDNPVRQQKAKEATNDRWRVLAKFSSLTGPPDDIHGCYHCSARQTLSSDGSRSREPSEIQT